MHEFTAQHARLALGMNRLDGGVEHLIGAIDKVELLRTLDGADIVQDVRCIDKV